MQWGLLGPATLTGEARMRTLEIGRAVRRFNELAVPGLGGVWYGKQLLLAVLGVRVAELAREKGTFVSNIECANAIEALACWLGYKSIKWAQDPRLRGINKFPRQHAMDFAAVRRSGFYVSQPMRMAVGQSLIPLGLADGESRRFNALRSNETGLNLITHACDVSKPLDRELEFLLKWVQGGEFVCHRHFVKLLSPCEPLSTAARSLLHSQLMLGAPQEDAVSKNRRRAVLKWVEDIRQNPPATVLDWEDRPHAISDDAHWKDLQAGARLMVCRDQALRVLNTLERGVALAPKETMRIDDAAVRVANELTDLRRVARQYLSFAHADNEAMQFCQECSLGSENEQLGALLHRDGRVLRRVGHKVRPGPAFSRALSNAPESERSQSTFLDPNDKGVSDDAIKWPAGLSFRVPNLYMLNKDLSEGQDVSLTERMDIEPEGRVV